MGLGIVKSLAGFLLLLNFSMYVIVAAIAGWALNKAIDHDYVTGPRRTLPAGFSFAPVFFPIGNEATGFMVIFSLIAGVVGAASCLSGLHHLRVWTAESLASSASSAMTAWALTLLSMGLLMFSTTTQKEQISNLDLCYDILAVQIALESFVIILSVTELFYMMLIHAGFFGGKYFSYRETHVATTTAEPLKGSTAAA
ncbi:hypothetical protein KI387_025813 [Taxus chinensis]|uniref:Uncharacterized protein n=1 Tax=Taxus chinensis TaxID=29808 RepID=A0AA38FVD1_TAXCH|nr:hypothetical protein KI387_025813 [Taxus chinensis]